MSEDEFQEHDPRLSLVQNSTAYPFETSLDLKDLHPPPMIIEGILPRGSITGITSYPGVGKTWLALEIARAVACRDKLINKFQCELGSVLFVGSDASKFDYARQWRKLINQTWEKEYEFLVGNTRFLLSSSFMLDDINDICRLIKSNNEFEWGDLEFTENEIGQYEDFSKTGFSVIIFDTLSKLTTANQNDNAEMEEIFRNIRFLSEQTQAAIILLHHNSKRSDHNSGDDWRGAMSQIGALDNWFDIKLHKTREVGRVLDIKKFRGLTPEPFFYDMLIDEETASLQPGQDAQEDNAVYTGVQGSIITWLKIIPNSTWSVKEIVEGIHPEYKILFPDVEAFTRFVRNRLNYMSQQYPPLVGKEGGGKKFAKVKFTAIEGT